MVQWEAVGHRWPAIAEPGQAFMTELSTWALQTCPLRQPTQAVSVCLSPHRICPAP